jgi:glutamine amidotransferase
MAGIDIGLVGGLNMCQLLGMNSKQPASVQFSLDGFVRRGGETDHHADGWGIAFFADKQCRVFTDSQPSISSPLVDSLRSQSIKSHNVIAHVRKATRGDVSDVNCHPFTRDLWGNQWAFAHNGTLESYAPSFNGRYAPTGETDSEAAFCDILQQLRDYFGCRAPSLKALKQKLQGLSSDIAQNGAFNYLLSDGKNLFAHCTTDLCAVNRRAPFGQAQLIDCEAVIDFSRHNQPDDCMTLIATKPLTHNEDWELFSPGELKLFVRGREYAAT